MCKNIKHHSNTDKKIIKPKPILVDIKSNSNIKDDITLDKEIASFLDQVALERIKSKVNFLSSNFHNRHNKSNNIHKAADWLIKEFKTIGYKDVYLDNYKANIGDNNYELCNVICKKDVKNRKDKDRKYILLCAHFDTILNIEGGDHPDVRAPGANDNASGVSAILEIANILYSHDLKYDIQFTLFSGEEQGLLGSKHYSQYVKENGINIFRLINLDMIGSPFPDPKIAIIEVDNNDDLTYNKRPENDSDSIKFGKLIRNITSTYTNLEFEPGLIWGSDYQDFESNGVVVVGIYDGGAMYSGNYHNPDYHSVTDTPDKIDWNYLTSITKMILATILTLDKEIKLNND